MRIGKYVAVAAIVLLLAPSAARADWIVTPFVGGNFSASNGASDLGTNKRVDFGASAGYMSKGIVGFEVEFGYSPSFFGDKNLIGSNNVSTLMGDVILGAPLGDGVTQVRPYVSAGVGLLRSRIGGNANDLFDITSNDFGVNVGAGAMLFFSPNVGVRADLRYFRSVNGTANNAIDVDFGGFRYWRGTGGVVFRF